MSVKKKPTSQHPAFNFIRSEVIESLNLLVEEYEHSGTGAKHFHLVSDNPENVFLVALRTIPTDSSGVAHILEHTALCGSEKYPVRDPFFLMVRRSLNTFMNAFTSSDWTAYPFASQNLKDFNNLLDVYLDAVFFSRLHELDFAQEGHRVEFVEPTNPDSELQFKGVVFNEMKGAMSSPVSVLWQTLTKHLFPTTTYHYNSGGEPADIPNLTYEQLKAFYKRHYHPSNAIFMTYGNIPAQAHHEKMHAQALVRFEKDDSNITVTDEVHYEKPLHVTETYVLQEDDASEKTHVVMGWLLGPSIDLEAQLEAHLLSNVLLENSASPLRQALETTELANSPSPLCGLEDSNREMSFMCGLEGSEADRVPSIEALIVGVLERVAEEGVAQDRVEAILHQLELHQREVGGGGYPYGLQLMLSGLSAAIHRGDPIALLNLDPVLATLRTRIQDPEYIKGLVRKLLLQNPHRVTLTLSPDTALADKQLAAEKARLAEIKASMSDDAKQAVVKLAQQLEARQAQIDDDSILPKVGREDIPSELIVPKPAEVTASLPLTYFSQGTNGLVYQQVVVDLPSLNDELLYALPYYCALLGELGAGDKSYLEVQDWDSSVTGGISAYAKILGGVDNEQQLRGHFVLSSKALSRNAQSMSSLLKTLFTAPRFDEFSRIRELVAQMRARRENSITGSGHTLAMTAACAGMSNGARFTERVSGMSGIQAIKEFDKRLDDEKEAEAFAIKMVQIHQKLMAAPRQYLLVGEEDKQQDYIQALEQEWSDVLLPTSNEHFAMNAVNENVQQAWVTNTQVNFCAKAYKTVAPDHPDAPILSVLGGFMRNGILHRTIREQGGAYGGGAGQDSAIGAFRFYSYRDPRLTETLDDFDRAIDWVMNDAHSESALEEAVLGVVSSIDKPGSPAGEAKQAFHNRLNGRDKSQREKYRQRVIETTLEDLKRVTEKYLKPANASVAVVTNKGGIGTLQQKLPSLDVQQV